jgi:hypothetical protein
MTDGEVGVSGVALSTMVASLVARSVGLGIGIAAALLAITAWVVS